MYASGQTKRVLVVLDTPITYLKVQTRETDKHLFTKKWLKPKQSCGRWLAHFSGSTMCDFNLESFGWDWMHADVYKALRGRDSDKSLYLWLLWWLVTCVVSSKTSPIIPGYKAFWCPQAVLCKPWEGFLIHLFMVVTGISYIWHTCGQ